MILASIVPFFVLVAYRFSSHLHYSKFIIFSSSTFIIITNPYKKKQTAFSNMFYLLFSIYYLVKKDGINYDYL